MEGQKYLVSDLDGTLIPWEGINRLGSFQSLKQLTRTMREQKLNFIILTGRSFANILQAMNDYPLPEPELIFSSAGAILHRKKGLAWEVCSEHKAYLEKENPLWDREEILRRLDGIEGLKNQGEIHQAPYKLSYYLYTLDYEPVLEEAERRLGDLADALSLQIYPEPERGWCYLDVMALEADKKGALTYLSRGEIQGSYVFAGDNWNDRSAFLSDHPAILVKNTPADLKRETERKNPRQFIARGKAKERTGNFADGVLEGLENMGWVN
ncbi:MAG: HAD-IIB family hydrolase [Spirochaetales bacterium]|nr:HAD-IIB family hydrolase [Spirochaetales bacterium]